MATTTTVGPRREAGLRGWSGRARTEVARATVAEGGPAASDRAPRRQGVGTVALVLAGYAVLLLVARAWGEAILDSGRVIRLGAPPFVGWDRWRPSWRVAVPVAAGAAAVALAPAAAARLPWCRLLAGSAVLGAAWAVALALVDGTAGITHPTVLPGDEYLLDVPRVAELGPHRFLATFTDRIDDYVVHVRSHPPGTVLLLWGLDRVGLGGQWPAALLMIAGGAAAVPAVLHTVRDVAGEAAARRAAPFVAVAPMAIWVATSADALFAGATSVATALFASATARRDRGGDLRAVAAGVGYGGALLLTYGAVLFAVVPAALAWHRRHLRALLLAAAGVAAVVAAFAAAGFWWVDGALTSRAEYAQSVARDRPLRYFAVANVAALAVVVGPATVVALTRLRDRGVWLLVAPAAAAMAVADVSGLSKGEVERLWLPFSVWLLAACSALAVRPAATRRWLALQVAVALAVQVSIYTRW